MVARRTFYKGLEARLTGKWRYSTGWFGHVRIEVQVQTNSDETRWKVADNSNLNFIGLKEFGS